MSTALNLSAGHTKASRRIPALAAASTLVVTASITVALALADGGGGTASQPSVAPPRATPDRATLYQRGTEVPRPSAADGSRSAERFHHFR